MASRWGNLVVLLVFLLTVPAGVFFYFTSPGMGYPKSTAGIIAGVLALVGLALLPVALRRKLSESPAGEALSGGPRGGSATVAKGDRSVQVGGLYATQDKDGSWRVMKVLAVDAFAVHVRSYANKFPEQPKDVDPAKLTLGGLTDPAGFGIGHFPLAKEGFFKENPILIKVVPVKEEELEGYKLYLEAMKGSR